MSYKLSSLKSSTHFTTFTTLLITNKARLALVNNGRTIRPCETDISYFELKTFVNIFHYFNETWLSSTNGYSKLWLEKDNLPLSTLATKLVTKFGSVGLK